MTLLLLFRQILISYCKFLMPRPWKWSILSALTILLSKNIHKGTKTDHVWFDFLWIRRYHRTLRFCFWNLLNLLNKRYEHIYFNHINIIYRKEKANTLVTFIHSYSKTSWITGPSTNLLTPDLPEKPCYYPKLQQLEFIEN